MKAEQLQDKAVDLIIATIANTETTSDAILLFGTTAVTMEMPATITGTIVTFEGSIDNGTTFKQIKDRLDAIITFTVAADGSYPLDANIFAGYDQIKLVMDVQDAERLIKVKPFAI